MKKSLQLVATSLLLFCSLSISAQDVDLERTIREKDSLFWLAYNKCDDAGMHEFIADDVEFYHDKGGIQKGWATFQETTKKNLCGRADWRIRREAYPESYRIYPMEKDGRLYGAVLSGDHKFFVTENGKPEYWTGVAKFTHLWLLTDGKWKMSRILSYNHDAPKYENKRTEIFVSDKALSPFVGKYKSDQGELTFEKSSNGLTLYIRNNKYVLFPESQTTFFYKERDLTFEFVKSGDKVSKVIIRENGAIVGESPVVK
ncbi:MAG: nuclear transport factor 2 family protein [Flavobacterium sp.]|uniref:nuclear transport factor 2 family protein n=1 Tax=Flavobacterium sp. TaxID=239 RepID=UPI0012274CC1|nr:nuclear transport factor 2 family protein [Flavobacterium sp.]RZJ67036.1 MAG: nuclear transport factor 2 family protein [Flavobacterium sp.]